MLVRKILRVEADTSQRNERIAILDLVAFVGAATFAALVGTAWLASRFRFGFSQLGDWRSSRAMLASSLSSSPMIVSWRVSSSAERASLCWS
jgi:hypothetical protein